MESAYGWRLYHDTLSRILDASVFRDEEVVSKPSASLSTSSSTTLCPVVSTNIVAVIKRVGGKSGHKLAETQPLSATRLSRDGNERVPSI